MIAIVDYGMGNVGSIVNMIKKVHGDCLVAKSSVDIKNAQKLILPGVGHFDSAIRNLKGSSFYATLNTEVLQNKKPVLGICLGMQLMAQKSEEGGEPGLGWMDAEVQRFNIDEQEYKVPHMGWNNITVVKENSLLKNTKAEQRFYFVHSYFVVCNNRDNIIAIATHAHEFTCAFQSENIFGVQFHPEKSHRFGMELLGKFLEY